MIFVVEPNWSMVHGELLLEGVLFHSPRTFLLFNQTDIYRNGISLELLRVLRSGSELPSSLLSEAGFDKSHARPTVQNKLKVTRASTLLNVA